MVIYETEEDAQKAGRDVPCRRAAYAGYPVTLKTVEVREVLAAV